MLTKSYIFEKLLNSEREIHFIDGPSGSDKGFLYKTFIFYFLSKEKKIFLHTARKVRTVRPASEKQPTHFTLRVEKISIYT